MLSVCSLLLLAAALLAILASGTLHLRTSISSYSAQTTLIAAATAAIAYLESDAWLYGLAAGIFLLKAICVPAFLTWITRKLDAHRDRGFILAPPLVMHANIILLGGSYLLASKSTLASGASYGVTGLTVAASMLATGLSLMLTRRFAISQIVGFLTIENSIFVFALTQTKGMPMFVEMGIMLDLLAGVMLAGVLVFRINHSFEHIDVGELKELRD